MGLGIEVVENKAGPGISIAGVHYAGHSCAEVKMSMQAADWKVTALGANSFKAKRGDDSYTLTFHPASPPPPVSERPEV